ncbi:phosphatase domain-containing protein [Tersicoccus sp. MR15.9]|uniref:phosphatase domain-containing protein n=1 Tax=Tersicoccus mangrovi TaxID=3121635 RepID=UPI002FE5CEB2
MLRRIRALARRTHRGARPEVALRLASTLDARALDAYVRHADLDALLGDAGHPVLGTTAQLRLLTRLTRDRLADLSVPARARVLAALQTGATTAVAEQAVVRVFEATTGEDDLRLLRNLCDGDGTHQDLAKLVFSDVDDPVIRDRILRHIAAHAGTHGGVKILSDVDDTLVANLKDRFYPRGSIYPGAVAFYDALDRGPASTPNPMGDVAFVTARPSDPFGLFESGTHRMVRARGIGSATVLSGSLLNLFTHGSMAAKKVENVREYVQLFPDYGIVFIGDNGQGDVEVAERIVDSWPDALRAVYIHAVLPAADAERERLAGLGITLVNTHVGAAVHARQAGLLSDEQADAVAADARDAVEAVRFADAEAERGARAELERDLAAL